MLKQDAYKIVFFNLKNKNYITGCEIILQRVTDISENRNSSGIEIFIGENPNANRDSNENQVLGQPAASSEGRLQPPPRAPPAINPMLNRLVRTRNESYFKVRISLFSLFFLNPRLFH